MSMELLGKTNIDFIGMKKVSFVISGIFAIIGLIGIVQIARGAANMGIDFSGGTEIQLKFAQPVSTEQARSALSKEGIKEVDLQEIKDGNKLLVKMRKSGKVADAVEAAFKKEMPGNPYTVDSSTEIGPSIGDKLKHDTMIAVIISMLGIVVYIAWRFDYKFGVGAVVATMHDVLFMIAVFYVAGKEVNLLFITAVLTIAGYSLTDTVVVFDRIRENLHKSLKDPLPQVFNRSINEVLSRTIVTSLTVFLASVTLFLFGGEVIHDFAFALLCGVLVGTYSSIFVASPIVALWEKPAEEAKA
ncbi:protein-export membrane protein SecF [Geomonas sp. Red276]